MRNFFTSSVLLVFMVFNAIGQETTVPGGELNALNDAVLAADSGDVLILAAGEIYPNQGSIDVNKDITIMGQGSVEEGNLPYIKELPAADGSWASQSIQVLNTFKIYNVFFNGFRGDEENKCNDRCFRVNSPIDTLIIEGCVFEQYRRRTVSLNKPVNYTKCSNTIFNHNWKIGGLGEGRPIDMRNGGHGTVILENCTFVNSSDRHIRHQKWGSLKAPVVDELIINQCTFLNSGNYRPTFSFWSISDLTFTNNLVVNYALFGSDTITHRKTELPYLEGSDAVTTYGPFAICPFTLTEVDSFNTTVTMSHNNVVQDPAIAALFDAGTQVSMPPLYNNEFAGLIDEATASFEELITFNSVPAVPSEMITEYVASADTVSDGGVIEPIYDIEYMKYDLLDLGYDAASTSASAAIDGGPLGDRRWMGVVGVEDHLGADKQLRFVQNYPNPFSESTTIRFILKEASDVSFILYNVVGAKVRIIGDLYFGQGMNEITLERGNLGSGIYFLQLSSEKTSDLVKLSIK